MHSGLGADLRKARRTAGRTQSDVAGQVACSVLAVRQAEAGRGAFPVFASLAAACGMAVAAKSAPPGDALGPRLLALRRRLGLGRRAAATLADISATTVAAIERGAACHTDAVARLAAALGVPLRLVPVGAQAGFWQAAGTTSSYHGWTTPSWLLEALYPLVGGAFALDPCSPVKRGPGAPVRARTRFTAEDDALALSWRAPTVFVNPPYGRVLGQWVAKARREQAEGRAGVVIALVPARTDTRWWHDHVAGHADIWLLRGRLAFGGGAAPAPFPSAVVAWGVDAATRAEIGQALPGAWHIAASRADHLVKPHE